ncbi:MAG TPA: hypothetical protein VJO32_09570 [Ktedonobacteraceae bacterium]|nr:hypothetical protein [Ktedonobacteraceae bacterium]
MIQTRDTQHTRSIDSNISAIYPAQNATVFYPTRQAYQRNRQFAILLVILSAFGSALLAISAIFFWPTYTHPFTPYLKWQDALLAILCYGSFILLIASITLFRFYLACRQGYRRGILILQPQGILTVRDLSPKNFASIYRMIGSSFTCFLVTLIGLAPCILIGWTLHLDHLIFILLTTAVAIAISLAGLTVSLIFGTFVVISLIGARAFTRTLGASHTYHLTKLTTLRIDNNVLTITCPDRPETLFDLNLLHPHDQQHLLQLLHLHPRQDSIAQPRQRPLLGQHIEAALQHSLTRPPVSA